MSQTIPLATLEPCFIVLDREAKTFQSVDVNDNADGVLFLCPKCYLEAGSGVHSVICWVPSVSDEIFPGPGRWDLHGQADNLTLTGGNGASSSVQLTGEGGCQAHFFVKNGMIDMC